MNRNATLNILRKQAADLIDCIKSEKTFKGLAWENAIPGTSQGKAWFKNYCAAKANLKKYRSELNTINALIRHIKKNVK